jgi:hypothetical protein
MYRPVALRPPLTYARSCLLVVALLLAGCGLGQTGHQAPVRVTITRDFGAVVVREAQTKSDAKLGALLRGQPSGQHWINGVAAGSGATVHGGDRVWADIATAVARTPAVVGSFPEPFLHGIDGKRLPVRIECADPRGPACRQVGDALARYEIPAARGGLQTARAPETLRVLVGPWSALRLDPDANAIEHGPRASGVYARVAPDGRTIAVLAADGRVARTLGAGSGLVAAVKRPDDRPLWVVTGTDAAGVESAARAFDEGTLAHRFALAVSHDLPVALPSGH